MLNLSFNELKLVAKRRGIKGYKSMPKVKLLSTLVNQNQQKVKTVLIMKDQKRLEKTEELRDRFSNHQVKRLGKMSIT